MTVNEIHKLLKEKGLTLKKTEYNGNVYHVAKYHCAYISCVEYPYIEIVAYGIRKHPKEKDDPDKVDIRKNGKCVILNKNYFKENIINILNNFDN